MDFGGNAVHVITGTGSENWSNEVWATEDEYRAWNNDGENSADNNSNWNYDQRQSQSRSGSEPPNKKSRNSQDATSSNRSKAIGKMFFKTKLCCKFRAGTCPYITNCNFAHSIEELRRPPPNWQEIVAAHEEERGVVTAEPREEFQIPSVGSSGFSSETPRSYKGRHCKKFYTEEGCPYGDSCTFLHDEQSKNRESVAISLGPGGYNGAPTAGANTKPSNWKTRICNKWELTGYCPFGNKCHFAHGAAELHRYGGGLMETEARDSSTLPPELKQGGGLKPPGDTGASLIPSVPHSESYQRSTVVAQRVAQRPHQKWKGPDKISRIYGDWIDEIE